MDYQFTEEFAKKADQLDHLAKYRELFHFPQHEGENCLYYTGNSLGLQPRTTKAIIEEELEDWAQYGVEGHFHARRPWFAYHEFLTDMSAKVVGALPSEVVITHSLTTNIHLLFVSFYRPTEKRYKIICEKKAFPSDAYAIESQVKFHGLDPDDAIIEVGPREGEHTIRHEDIIQAIEDHGEEVALVFFGGVNYFTGQVFDMEAITQAGHEKGCIVGFDLAHAAGNIILKLHDWGVDFAAWCSYKYLNSGPGGVSGMFVHERYGNNPQLPRFAGWWGYDKDSRFKMEPGFVPMKGAEGWQLSNAPVMGMACLLASLRIFDEVGMAALRSKSEKLSGYLEYVVDQVSSGSDKADFEMITPRNWNERGAQVSLLTHGQGRELFDKLTAGGVIADWREPNVIRLAPVPLYNSFMDVYRFGRKLQAAIG